MLAASTWDIVTSVGTAVGGLGAAAGALAAWKAALASRATSQDALEALALAMEPSVHMDVYEGPRETGAPMPGPTRMMLNIRNSARWAASAVDIEMTLGDGEVIRSHHELLDTMIEDGDINLPIRDVTAEWPPHDSADVFSVVVRYSDLRGIGRYEQAMTVGLIGGKLPNMGVQMDTSPGRWRRLR